ncbi:hypothetical protein X551_04391 [Methylibium sp. T29]|nr:hypothetical protein X551_04391 [Methylibium sp. T29]
MRAGRSPPTPISQPPTSPGVMSWIGGSSAPSRSGGDSWPSVKNTTRVFGSIARAVRMVQLMPLPMLLALAQRMRPSMRSSEASSSS